MAQQKLHQPKWIVLTIIFGLVSAFALLVFFRKSPVTAFAQPEANVGDRNTTQAVLLSRDWANIEPTVLFELEAQGETDFFIWMQDKADLTYSIELTTKAAKGEFVFNTLRTTAERTQYDLRLLLDSLGADYRPFYIANKILVQGGDLALLQEIAAQPNVARITANHQYQMPEILEINDNPSHPQVIEDNLIFVNADDVWALGITGQGIVLAGNDSGIDETHPAIARHYRGCINPPTCSSWEHNYNWWDATGTYPGDPGDGHFHGTWTTGVMIGDDGGANQIGIAPGAKTIHCKMWDDVGVASDATITECLEWDLAPWDLNGQNPDPAQAPHAVNNSWGYTWGEEEQFRDEIQALRSAGILVAATAGNSGPDCATIESPGDYHEVFTVGSVSNVGSLPGTLSSFSSRGPSDLDGSPPHYFPDIMAPGESVRSSISKPGYPLYLSGSGTSAAAPHVTGLVGLVWEACPSLKGMVDTTVDLIRNTAVPLTGQPGSGCGGDYVTGPNNDWGFGTIDALAAVQRAQAICGDIGTLHGTVYHTPTMALIANAEIVADRLEGGQWTSNTGVGGDYTATLFEGAYTTTASAYGFSPQVIGSVVVTGGITTTQDFYLETAPSYLVTGTVSTLEEGAPLSATIKVLNTPLAPVRTDPVTGAYSITVAEGMYDVRVDAIGYQTAGRVITVDQDQGQDFALEAKPCVLLVEDDGPLDNSNVGYYTSALSNLGYDFEIFETGFAPGNGPTYQQMREYRLVIWFSADTRNDFYGAAGPNATDEGHLAAYLDDGGTLLLSSQDYLFARGLSSFGTDYLGISSYSNDTGQTIMAGTPGDPIGNGLGPYILSPVFPLLPDNVTGVQASPFYWLGTGLGNSTSYVGDTFRTVFFAWPLEVLTDLEDRSVVMERAINWLGGCMQPAPYELYLPVIQSSVGTVGDSPVTFGQENQVAGLSMILLLSFGMGAGLLVRRTEKNSLAP